MSKYKKYFDSICNINRSLGATLSFEKHIKLIVTGAVETMEGKAAALFLGDAKKEIFHLAAQTGLSEKYLHTDPINAQGQISAVMGNGFLAVEDATTDPVVLNHAAKKAEGIASMLKVPVRVKDNMIGILTLYTGERRKFAKDDIVYLSALAEIGGIVIEHDKIRKRMSTNTVLFQNLVNSINSSLDIKEVMQKLTVDLAEALHMKGVIIRLLDEKSGTMQPVAYHGFSQEFIDKGPVTLDKSINPVLKGETVVINDVANDELIQYPEEVRKEGIHSMLIVPMFSGEKVIGAIRLCSKVEREYPKDMITLVKALATQGALAIQNATMYMQLEESLKDLEENVWSHRSWF